MVHYLHTLGYDNLLQLRAFLHRTCWQPQAHGAARHYQKGIRRPKASPVKDNAVPNGLSNEQRSKRYSELTLSLRNDVSHLAPPIACLNAGNRNTSLRNSCLKPPLAHSGSILAR